MLHENRRAVEAFLSCATQWRVAPMGGLIGLDYAGVKAACPWAFRKDTFWRLRVIESAALKAMAENAERKKSKDRG